MKRALGLGLLVGMMFVIFILIKDSIGINSFYMAALAMAMFAVLGPFGDYFKAGIAILIGVFVGLAGIIVLVLLMPLPPENIPYLALVSGLSLFLLVLISTIGLRIDAMFLGWAGYFAAVFGTYTADAAALATEAMPAAIGVSVSLLLGLLMAMVIIRMAMLINQ